MDPNLQIILQQLQAEKSVDRETLLEAIRSALESAARKSFHHAAEIVVEVDPNSLSFKVFEIRSVAEEVEDPTKEMSLAEAIELNPAAKVGDRLKVQTEPKNFGRIAAQTAKQVIIQKLKDAERESIYDEYKKREGELVTGVVKRNSHGNLIIGLGQAEAIMPIREQSPREGLKPGDRIRAYLIEVEKSSRGPQIVLSRTTPELVRSLFELEVPEIYDGTIEIRGIAREPGSRTKIAVASNDPNVDPVGACVGMKGSRVRAVVEELCGEKIDIVRWSEDPVEMCGNALNPADILDITVNEEDTVIQVVVPHDQLSLAIGKRGQNARLASRLMGWNIDIKSDVELSGDQPPEGDADSAESQQAAEPEPEEPQLEEAAGISEEVTGQPEEAAETPEEAADQPEEVAGQPEEAAETPEEATETPEEVTDQPKPETMPSTDETEDEGDPS